jgi:hypothetical protein
MKLALSQEEESQCSFKEKTLHKGFRVTYLAFRHRDKAASLALVDRCFGESFFARAFPPFNPPNRPKIAAAEVFIFCPCRLLIFSI